MSVRPTKTPRRQNQKNLRARSAKISHYKLLQVLECFAADLSIKQASLRTRISERALRDLYQKIRQRMVDAALHDPSVFNGVNALFTDVDGNLEADVLTFMGAYSRTGTFKDRMRRLYPRTNPKTQPMLFFVLEYFIRRYLAIAPPQITSAFREGVTRTFSAAALFAHALANDSASKDKIGRAAWSLARAGITATLGDKVRRYGDSGRGRLFRDLKAILLREPL